jgi:hypothetical protein
LSFSHGGSLDCFVDNVLHSANVAQVRKVCGLHGFGHVAVACGVVFGFDESRKVCGFDLKHVVEHDEIVVWELDSFKHGFLSVELIDKEWNSSQARRSRPSAQVL